MPQISLNVNGTAVSVTVNELVIAGWAGRDAHAVQHHIDELAAIGVAPPSSVPLYYRNGASVLTQDETVQVVGEESSGEAEPVLISTPQGLVVTVGSDHTDRALETHNVAFSKQVCPKVIAREGWPLSEVLDHWDELRLVSRAVINGEEVLYQDDALAKLRPPEDLLPRFTGVPGLSLPAGHAMFGGTVAAIGGIRPASRFTMELHDPVLGRVIRHSYAISTLPVVA